jgi:glycosyltransferase involved in cell wall biosynthesis
MDYLTFYWSAAVMLRRIAGSGDVIIAKTDPPMINTVAALIAWLNGAVLLNWMQDVYPEVAEKLHVKGLTLFGGALRRIRNWTCGVAVRNIVIGGCMRDFLIRAGINGAQISVIPNWVNDAIIQPLPKQKNSLRVAWSLQDRLVVGYSGNMGRSHNFDAVLDAADALRHESQIRFLFIGDGAKKGELESYVKKKSLTNVNFLSHQPDVLLPLSLTVPDIHIVTLQNELAGLIVPSKFYGALAAGRPVIYIGPGDCEVANVIREFDCGFHLGEDDSGRLCEIVQTLASDDVLRAKMGENARRALDSLYSRERALSAWQSVIAQAVSGAMAQDAIATDAAKH